MTSHGYKKYMKKDTQKNNNVLKVFVFSFFGMLLVFSFIFSYLSKNMTVDTSIGEYKEQQIDDMEDKKIVDLNRLEKIQNEDQGRNFSDLMADANNDNSAIERNDNTIKTQEQIESTQAEVQNEPPKEFVYKVYIGSYASAEQAKVAKEIIVESGSAINPIVKNIGQNEYTLQVGIFKNKQSADAMLSTVLKNNLPGRIVKE